MVAVVNKKSSAVTLKPSDIPPGSVITWGDCSTYWLVIQGGRRVDLLTGINSQFSDGCVYHGLRVVKAEVHVNV